MGWGSAPCSARTHARTNRRARTRAQPHPFMYARTHARTHGAQMHAHTSTQARAHARTRTQMLARSHARTQVHARLHARARARCTRTGTRAKSHARSRALQGSAAPSSWPTSSATPSGPRRARQTRAPKSRARIAAEFAARAEAESLRGRGCGARPSLRLRARGSGGLGTRRERLSGSVGRGSGWRGERRGGGSNICETCIGRPRLSEPSPTCPTRAPLVGKVRAQCAECSDSWRAPASIVPLPPPFFLFCVFETSKCGWNQAARAFSASRRGDLDRILLLYYIYIYISAKQTEPTKVGPSAPCRRACENSAGAVDGPATLSNRRGAFSPGRDEVKRIERFESLF